MFRLLFTFSVLISSINLNFASDNPTHSALNIPSNEKSFVINMDAFQGKLNFVTIADCSGEIIFTDSIESSKQRVKYVLDNLPNNNVYTVMLKGEDLIEYYTIKITEDPIQIVNIETYLSPNIINNGDKITVEANNYVQDNISFTIYDNNEDVVYSYSENHVGAYQKIFDLHKLDAGSYRVLVSNNQFTKEFSLTL